MDRPAEERNISKNHSLGIILIIQFWKKRDFGDVL